MISIRATSTLILSLWAGYSVAGQSEEPSPHFVGTKACLACHADTYDKWNGSRHSKMVQPARPEGVKGNFRAGRIRLRGEEYLVETVGGKYYITESRIEGRPKRHRVLYTLGNRRIQHYLTALGDGRIVVLPPTWDVLRKEWFHNMEIVGPEPEGATAVQVWNKNCFGCHVNEQKRNFDLKTKSYDTTWRDYGTGCERCHGPGSFHVESYQTGDPSIDGSMVVQTELDNVRNTMVCGQCHSLRDTLAPGFHAGENYFDYFLPQLEYGLDYGYDPPWYPDGKTRRFSSNTLAIWQSRCFREGKVACTDCHRDMHDPEIEKNTQLRPTNRELCTRCHASIGENLEAHTHHEASSSGSACIACHMPRSVTSIKAKMRDHSISIPAPENTARFGIPNACNLCHEDETPGWAAETLDRWFPGSTARQKYLRRAEVFTEARKGGPGVVEKLVALASDTTEPPLIRANAVGYLGRYPNDPRTMPALLRAFASEEPIIRAVAMPQFGRLPRSMKDTLQPFLVRALHDDVRAVRMGAAFSLLSLGVLELEGEAGQLFERAKLDYVARANTSPDHAPTQLALAKFHLQNHDLENAARAFEVSLALDPDQPNATYYRALARLGEGKQKEAAKLLEDVSAKSEYYQTARALLANLSRQ